MSATSKIALFAAGTLFGSVGLKALSTKEAKKVYVKTTAAGLRLKDYIMDEVTLLQENANDILAEAKELNEEKAKLEKSLSENTLIFDEEEKEEEEVSPEEEA